MQRKSGQMSALTLSEQKGHEILVVGFICGRPRYNVKLSSVSENIKSSIIGECYVVCLYYLVF